MSLAPEPHRQPGAKPAADGYQRTSLDLPNQLYERLKIAALMERQPLRAIIEQAALEWLERAAYYDNQRQRIMRVERAIESLQEIQKHNRCDTPQWQAASDALAPLFEFMAAHQESETPGA